MEGGDGKERKKRLEKEGGRKEKRKWVRKEREETRGSGGVDVSWPDL